MFVGGSNLVLILLAQICTWFLTVLAEKLVKPGTRFPICNPKIVAVHFFISNCFFYFILIFTGRVLFTAILGFSLFLLLIFVNNAKYKSLHEPVLFSDYDYVLDAFRFPRLYLPFLGVGYILGIIVLIFIAGCCYYYDSLRIELFDFQNYSLFWCMTNIVISLLVLYISSNVGNAVRFNPLSDLNNYGLLLSIWCYFIEYCKKPTVVSPFENLKFHLKQKIIDGTEDIQQNSCESSKFFENSSLNKYKSDSLQGENSFLPDNPQTVDVLNCAELKKSDLPHLIAIQSESFFDPRKWNSNIKTDILKNFDILRSKSVMHGLVKVPAWGANTIRTEFSFLSGVAPEKMKVHQFSPYQICARNFEIKTMVEFLKSMGYYTVCIHPYFSSFYHRNIIFKKWGFDEFFDLKSFSDGQKCGAYVSDYALAEFALKIIHKNKAEGKHVFLFMITMENHGPLNLEPIEDHEFRYYFNEIPVNQENNRFFYRTYRDLAVYLRHLKNCDQMLYMLSNELEKICDNCSVVFYGDHIPILGDLYDSDGCPDARVPYFIWNNKQRVNNNCFQYLSKSIDQYDTINIESLSVEWIAMLLHRYLRM